MAVTELNPGIVCILVFGVFGLFPVSDLDAGEFLTWLLYTSTVGTKSSDCWASGLDVLHRFSVHHSVEVKALKRGGPGPPGQRPPPPPGLDTLALK